MPDDDRSESAGQTADHDPNFNAASASAPAPPRQDPRARTGFRPGFPPSESRTPRPKSPEIQIRHSRPRYSWPVHEHPLDPARDRGLPSRALVHDLSNSCRSCLLLGHSTPPCGRPNLGEEQPRSAGSVHILGVVGRAHAGAGRRGTSLAPLTARCRRA